MTVQELQEMMDEHEKFVLGEIAKMKKEQITEGSVIPKDKPKSDTCGKGETP